VFYFLQLSNTKQSILFLQIIVLNR